MTEPSLRHHEPDVQRILDFIGAPVAAKSGPPSLVLTVGLPGSGKSTFCRRLAQLTGAVILESDALRSLLFDRPTHQPEENRILFAALYEAARRLLQQNVTVIIDATNLREADRQPAYRLASECDAKLLALYFSAPEQVIEQRLTGRNQGFDSNDKSTAGMAVYRRMIETAQPLKGDHWRIDTSQPEALEKTLREIAAVLEPARTH